MNRTDTPVASQLFPGPRNCAARAQPLIAEPLWPGGQAPAIYRLWGLDAATFRHLWPALITSRPLVLSGHRPHHNTSDAVLVFAFKDRAFSLGIAATIRQFRDDGAVLIADRPPLSWRLLAVNIARSLNAEPNRPCTLPSSPSIDPGRLEGRQLRLRSDLPSPATCIAPGEDLQRAVIALRAGFFDIVTLQRNTGIPPGRLNPFVAALDAMNFVVDAPAALESWNDPFAFFGLHWSAHDPLIRRRYHQLRDTADRADTIAGVDARTLLEHTFELLCRRRSRRRIRNRFLPPTAVAEVTEYFRSRFRRAQRHSDHDTAIDAARRFLELEPTDQTVRRRLTTLLCAHR